jgi:hypothetical protein
MKKNYNLGSLDPFKKKTTAGAVPRKINLQNNGN